MAEKPAPAPALADAATAFLARSKSWTATVLACAIFIPLMAYLHLRYFFSRVAVKKLSRQPKPSRPAQRSRHA